MSNWITVCSETDLTPDTGLCALHSGEQVAIFYCGKTKDVFAVSNYDPIGEANVLSRGLMGSIGDAVVVASPLYKQHFNLKTGECLEATEHTLKTYPIRIEAGEVQLQAA